MNEKLEHLEIGSWYTTDNDDDAIQCVVVDDLKKSFGELSDNIIVSSLIINNSVLVDEGQPILTLRFSEDLTGDITAFKTGIVKQLKSQGDKIKAGEILCKIYPYWECLYCSSIFNNEYDKKQHEEICRCKKIQKFENDIPVYNKIFAQINNESNEVKEFNRYWLAEFGKNNFINLDGNLSYLFDYAYKILTFEPNERIGILKKLYNAYKYEKKFMTYCKLWLSDSYLIIRDYENALRYFPITKVGSTNTHQTNALLSIKLQLNRHVSGKEILSLLGPKITLWAQKHFVEIIDEVNSKLQIYERKIKHSILSKWAIDCRQHSYNVFNGTWSSQNIDFFFYDFSSNPEVIEFIYQISTEAENDVRERYNLPKIGEGWISETELYYKIKEHFKSLSIIHGGKPKWLGKQHLDIYFPVYNIGIEYQGTQHYVSVDFFGGEKGLEKRKKLDEKKRIKCVKNNCTLIYVNEGYLIEEVISEISNAIEKQK